MINITLPDNSIKKVKKGSTPMEIAKSISEGLARNSFCSVKLMEMIGTLIEKF